MASRYPGNRDIREQFEAAMHRPPMVSGHGEEPQPEEDVSAGPYIHVAEYIPVRRWGQVLPFMKLSMQIYQYSRECPGFLAGGIRAKWWRRQFWSYTVWEDRESILRFVQNGPHTHAARVIDEFGAPGSCYVEWTSMSPPDWPEAVERLKTPTRYLVPPGPSGLR